MKSFLICPLSGLIPRHHSCNWPALGHIISGRETVSGGRQHTFKVSVGGGECILQISYNTITTSITVTIYYYHYHRHHHQNHHRHHHHHHHININITAWMCVTYIQHYTYFLPNCTSPSAYTYTYTITHTHILQQQHHCVDVYVYVYADGHVHMCTNTSVSVLYICIFIYVYLYISYMYILYIQYSKYSCSAIFRSAENVAKETIISGIATASCATQTKRELNTLHV